jgi:23S rRNA-/tRNA-specific pseudouridylate synthase
MSQQSPTVYVGFPPPLLGATPVRLEVLHVEEGFLALNKPSGIAAAHHPWYPRTPDVSASLQYQLVREKPELLRLGLLPGQPLQTVYNADPSASGVACFTWGQEAPERWRNAFGSSLLSFEFCFVAEGNATSDTFTCDLPLAPHFHEPRMVVSHQTGKKTTTHFRQLERFGRYSLWEATCDYLRLDQILLHALESGLTILGESKYTQSAPLYLSSLKGRRYRGNTEKEEPLYAFPAIHLQRLRLPAESSGSGDSESSNTPPESDSRILEASLPSRMQNLIKQLRKNAGTAFY